MRKIHKKALGLFGLATVVGMTAVAANLPTPAGAVSSVTDVISVTVVDNTTPAASIINIADGTVFTDPMVDISVDYVNLKNLTITLKWGSASAKSKSSDSGTAVLSTDNFSYAERTGTKNLTINLNDYGGYNRYSIFVEGDGYITGATPGDSVNFRYSSVSIDGIGTETDGDGNIIDSDITTDPTTGEPIITPETSTEVKDVLIQVYSKETGQEVITTTGKNNESIKLPFIFEDSGKSLPTGYYIIVLTGRDANQNPVGDPIKILYYYRAPQSGEAGQDPVVNVPEVSGGHYIIIDVIGSDGQPVIPGTRTDVGGDVTLPFIKNDIPTGTYTIIVTEYDEHGNVVRTYNFIYHYIPGAPKTGSFLSNLNISRADYLTTGAVVFGVALIFAFVFLRKKKGTRRR